MNAGYEPFTINPKFDRNMEVTADNFPVESYGAGFFSNSILHVHREYGEMAYNEGAQG